MEMERKVEQSSNESSRQQRCCADKRENWQKYHRGTEEPPHPTHTHTHTHTRTHFPPDTCLTEPSKYGRNGEGGKERGRAQGFQTSGEVCTCLSWPHTRWEEYSFIQKTNYPLIKGGLLLEQARCYLSCANTIIH